MKNSKVRKLTELALLTAAALIIFVIELQIPYPFPIPGIKPGFANLVIMAALYLLGLPYAAAVSFIRIILSFLLFGNVTSLLYSISGGVLSLFVIFLLKKFKVFDEIGVSISGAVAHNIGQTGAAALVLSSASVFYYLPVLLISSVVFGLINGLLLKLILKRVDAGKAV